jgi:ppGpp synthetase/RelA/SpoT-type nucleotidyltranferase
MKLLDKKRFLFEHNLDEQMLKDNNINWENMMEIYSNFLELRNTLEVHADLVANILRGHEKVHTVRSRVKDPEHLIAKLIRKTPKRKESKGEDFQFSIENYQDEITDLIGVRAIHIFKEDWELIHNIITDTWKVLEITANVRNGDETKRFDELKVEIDSRNTGYRSVHYLIEFFPTNKRIVAEIQVRTIFEEGYGEIDHQLRYPNGKVPDVLALNLLLFNRIVGSADEMASFINILSSSWEDMKTNYESIITEKNTEITRLKRKIESTDIKKHDKDDIFSSIDKILESNRHYNYTLSEHDIENNAYGKFIKNYVTRVGNNKSSNSVYNNSYINRLIRSQQVSDENDKN